ncbi:hypothetical protein C8R42DRAFT_643482 [Lentinula raphanica]|nr:hypothetical protein C8R42DRAFT_643482 [Lentinula raphanica]
MEGDLNLALGPWAFQRISAYTKTVKKVPGRSVSKMKMNSVTLLVNPGSGDRYRMCKGACVGVNGPQKKTFLTVDLSSKVYEILTLFCGSVRDLSLVSPPTSHISQFALDELRRITIMTAAGEGHMIVVIPHITALAAFVKETGKPFTYSTSLVWD